MNDFLMHTLITTAADQAVVSIYEVGISGCVNPLYCRGYEEISEPCGIGPIMVRFESNGQVETCPLGSYRG